MVTKNQEPEEERVIAEEPVGLQYVPPPGLPPKIPDEPEPEEERVIIEEPVGLYDAPPLVRPPTPPVEPEPEVSKPDEPDPTDIIRTPSGDITRAEHEVLLKEYPEGIPATAVAEVVEVREEPIPEPPEFEGYERTKEAGEIYFIKDGQYYRRMGSQMVQVPEPARARTERLYGVTGTERDITPESVTEEGMRPDEILIAMKNAGADATTLLKYMEDNPASRRGALAGQLVQGLQAQFIELSEQRGETRIATARTLGVLPEGFDELPQVLKTAYGVSDTAFNTAVETHNVKASSALDKLADFRDAEGLYDLQAAFDAGKGADVYVARDLGIFTTEQVLGARSRAIKARATAKVVEEERADFDVALEASNPDLYVIYKEQGAEGYNKHIEENYTKLPDGQYIDKGQLAEIRNTSLEIYNALMTGGMAAADRIVQAQQEAMRQLEDYKTAIPPELPVGIDAVTGAPAKFGYNIPKYLRENEFNTAILITAGFDPTVVNKVSAALKATERFWVDDKFNAYGALMGGVKSEHLETLTGKTSEDIKGLPMPFAQFRAEYERANPIVLEATKAVERAKELDFKINELRMRAASAFDEIYGAGSASKSMGIELAQLFFIPIKVLEPRVEWGDIKWWEYAIGGVQIAAITAPLWIPPVVRGVKWVFPKLRIGTYPFSEPAISRIQIQKARLLGTKTISASEIGMSDAQFARFLKFRITQPNTTPFQFRAMEAFEFEKMMRSVTQAARSGQKIPAKVSGLTPAQLAEQARILRNVTNDSWGGLWSAFDKQTALQRLAAAQAKAPLSASQIVAQAVRNEAMWRAMAEASLARVLPKGFFIPDYPFVIPLAISDLQISTNQLAGVQPLTTFQINAIAKAANITSAEVRVAIKAGTLVNILAKPAVAIKLITKTQGLTAIQIETLAKALSKTRSLTQADIASLTTAETKALADALTRAQVSAALAIEAAEAIAQIAKVMPAEVTQAATQALTKALVEGKTLAEAKVVAKVALQTTMKTVTPTEAIITPITPPITPTTPITPITPIIPITPITPKPPTTIRIPPVVILDVKGKPIKREQPIPEGSYAWKQGMYWKFIPPPYDQRKPITLKRGIIPMGAQRLEGRTPEQTIQIIGRSRKYKIPERVDVDMGVVDVFITSERGGTIVFAGKGLETNVGSRIDSPTKGMDLGEDGIDRGLFGDETFPGDSVTDRGIGRPSFRKTKPSRKRRKKGNDSRDDKLEIWGGI